MAGYVGVVDIAPLTVRELYWMYEGRYEVHDVALRSVIASIYNTFSKKWIKPDDLKEKPASDQEMTVEQTEALFIAMGVCTSGG
tara:strand:+ start:1202 stop:1453 length:252 start_codon:yes stop_codon:yes gene_type:complete